ncbi:hypothetical protein EJ08DRAFT_682946 [Tothia fuscella]|uniref:MACPF domain-containing protein n=1 Tax=Tothia fuscella TaxID=1048955 RepID=A0A9P4TU85_9PEZI|nr:hypothetical protein EJ08DRAFT_682946 [Tothia fuscella]
MTLIDDFPRDPFFPSLNYAASCLAPITLPWTQEPIALGSSLAVSRSRQPSGQLKDISAFSESSLQQSTLLFTPASGGETVETTTLGSASSTDHASFSVAASVGGSFLGASGRVQYEKHCMSGRAALQSSVRTSQRIGTISFKEMPHLSVEAIQLLRRSSEPDEEFAARYGQYFVAAYMLGAANAVLVGANAASQSFDKSITGHVTVKVFFAQGTKQINEQEHSHSQVASGSFTGFDTLSNWTDNRAAWDMRSYNELTTISSENTLRASILGRRLREKASDLKLDAYCESEMAWKESETVCRQGLVYELLLLPYAKLYDYAQAFWHESERTKEMLTIGGPLCLLSLNLKC